MANKTPKSRCWWPGDDPQYIVYHDNEWGRIVTTDNHLFEKITLEGFQAGLSWITILRKRENFRTAFDNFNIARVAKYNQAKIDELLLNAGIVRHKGKIASAINNANRALELIEEFGSLAAFFWQYEPAPETRPAKMTEAATKQLTKTPESTALSKALKKRGWSFVGPTTCYAFMQSEGIVNDHVENCFCRSEVETERAAFKRPAVLQRRS